MRRPLLLILFSLALGMVIGFYTSPAPVFYIVILSLFIAAIPAAFIFFRKGTVSSGIFKTELLRKKPFVLIAAAAVFFLIGGLDMSLTKEKESCLSESEGQVAEIEGVVTNVDIRESYAALTVRIKGEYILIRLSATDCDESLYALAGRRIRAKGSFSLPEGRRNLGCFDYRRYLKGKGILGILEVSKYRIFAGKKVLPLLNFLSVKKGRFYSLAREIAGEENFSVIAGLLFGDTAYMEEELYESFQKNGIAHVLAVSGLHVSLLYSWVLKLLKGKRGKLTSLVIVISLCIYAALSGFSISVLRASVMIILRLLSFHRRRRYDLVSAASLAAIIFILARPYLIFDSGTQLSFTAAYTMGIALPWAQSRLIQLADRLKSDFILKSGNILLPCIVVQLGMTPLTLWHFMVFSPIALLLNPFAIALAGVLLPWGLGSFVLSVPLAKIAVARKFILTPAIKITGFLARMLRILASGGTLIGGSYDAAAPPLGTLILYYIFFFWFFSETRFTLNRRQQHKTLISLEASLLILGVLLPWGLGITSTPVPWSYGMPSAVFVDVGQGDCIHLSRNGINVLIDGGGSYYSNVAENILKPYLLRNGITHIDLAIITHEDLDHSRGIYQLSEIFQVDKIIKIGSTNEDCGIIMAEAEGLKLLLMADADTEREKALISQYGELLSCDILKVGHHGSAGSTSYSLLKTASPAFGVISCGEGNSYGHPSDRVIELLDNSGIIYGRTDKNGGLYLKKVTESYFIIENAAKDKQWHIQKTKTQSTQAKQ